MRLGRLILLAIAIEGAAILVLVLAVALFGPRDPVAAEAYAQQLGNWIGPGAGLLFCLAGGWYAGRSLHRGQILNGLLLAALVAVLDVTILIASGTPFRMLFVISNGGRLVGGAAGGWVAARTRSKE